jgi:hypothetical protein
VHSRKSASGGHPSSLPHSYVPLQLNVYVRLYALVANHYDKIVRMARLAIYIRGRLSPRLCFRTMWTAATTASVGNSSFPFMAFVTEPPDLLVAVRSDILWRQSAILGRVPFLGKSGIYGFEAIIVANLLTTAIRAASAPGSAVDSSFPFMAFVTKPPDLLVAVRSDILWRQSAILGRVPLFR